MKLGRETIGLLKYKFLRIGTNAEMFLLQVDSTGCDRFEHIRYSFGRRRRLRSFRGRASGALLSVDTAWGDAAPHAEP